jgi:hypothetical protein
VHRGDGRLVVVGIRGKKAGRYQLATASSHADDVLLKIEIVKIRDVTPIPDNFNFIKRHMCLQNTETITHDGDAMSDSTDEISDEEEEEEKEEEESEFVRASNRLLSARQLFEHTVALGKKKKGQLKTLREEEERKREANFVAETQRLMSIIREMREGESSSTEEEKLREKECAEKEERRARLARKKAAKELEQAISSYDREVGEARKERRAKNKAEEAIEKALKEVERELEEVKLENDREEGEEKARNDAVADGLNRARAARVIQKAFRSKKNKKKRSKKGTKKKKATTTKKKT